MKTCSKCGKEYPATDEFFYRHTGYLRSHCKTCVKSTSTLWVKNNKERIKGYSKNKDHRENVAKRNREYRKRHKDKVREYDRLYKLNNSDIRNAQHHRRRALKNHTDGSYSNNDIKQIILNQKNKCWWCGNKIKGKQYHVDHRIPLSRGGTNWPENIVISCPDCNLRKHVKTPEEFALRLF